MVIRDFEVEVCLFKIIWIEARRGEILITVRPLCWLTALATLHWLQSIPQSPPRLSFNIFTRLLPDQRYFNGNFSSPKILLRILILFCFKKQFIYLCSVFKENHTFLKDLSNIFLLEFSFLVLCTVGLVMPCRNPCQNSIWREDVNKYCY